MRLASPGEGYFLWVDPRSRERRGFHLLAGFGFGI